MLDGVAGTGWRLVLDARSGPELSPAKQAELARLGVRPIRIGQDGDTAALVEKDAVVAGWFDRHGCVAALVRPDHYVFGVVSDLALLDDQLGQLAIALQ